MMRVYYSQIFPIRIKILNRHTRYDIMAMPYVQLTRPNIIASEYQVSDHVRGANPTAREFRPEETY